MLIILGGLPGVGKTTIARELARQLGAVHLRIDSIEQAIRASGGVETRTAGIPGSTSLTWQEVVTRDYRPWDRERVVIDTARRSVDENVKTLRAALL